MTLLRHSPSRRACALIFRRFDVTYAGRNQPCLGIRRETVNPWERRAPLAPTHVKKLTKSGIRVLIQPSNRRAFPIQDYVNAGAVVQEDLVQAQLILSVKQVPIEQLLPNKTYAFFSHTIKAQPDNMEMLDAILHRKIRLIDFEKFTREDGTRLVMFGKWAGIAGFIDILHGLGLRLLALGHHTPFLHIALAHNYSDSHMAINAVRDCGYEIALSRLPRSIGPLIFVFTGTGNVSQGAQELFKHLPHEFIDVSTLPQVAQKGQLNKVYGCVVSRTDHMMRKQVAICDISADPGGSIEFMTECTTIDKPFTIYDADLNKCSDSFNTPSGCLVCSIDNIPAQMPVEATEHFGNLLYPYIVDMLNCSVQPFDSLQCRDEVKRAVITWDGALTPNYKYISDLRKKSSRSYHKSSMSANSKKVLLLGAGMVSDPLAHYFSTQQHVQLTVATDSSRDGQRLAALGDNIESVVVDVQKEPEKT